MGSSHSFFLCEIDKHLHKQITTTSLIQLLLGLAGDTADTVARGRYVTESLPFSVPGMPGGEAGPVHTGSCCDLHFFPAGHFPQQQTVARTQEIRFRILLGVFRLKKKERKEKDTFENNNNKKIKRGFVAVSAAYFKTPFPVVL